MLLYIWSNQTQKSFSVYRMIYNDDKTENHDTFLLVTNATVITVTTDASFDVTHAAQKRKKLQMAEEDVAVPVIKEHALSNHSTFEDLQANSRSLNTDIVKENNFVIRPVISNSKTPPVHGNVIEEKHSNNDEVYKNISTIVNDRLYHTTKNE